jgi:putative phosphoesterase
MNIGFISDLHIDRSKHYQTNDFLQTLTQVIEDHELNQVYIGGDISNYYQDTLAFVEALQTRSHSHIYFIPGNHDYWQEQHDKKTTLAIHDIYKSHPQSLLNNVIMLNEDTAIIGQTGWYNHAYHAPHFTENQLNKGHYKLVTWQDKNRLDWQASDQEVSKYFARETKKNLEYAVEDLHAKEILLMTHVITIPEFTIPMPNRVFDFFNAYIATDDFLPFYDSFPITHSIMGHVHIRHQMKKDGIHYISNSLGYEREWRSTNLYQEITQALYIMKF